MDDDGTDPPASVLGCSPSFFSLLRNLKSYDFVRMPSASD